jgi:uncharacterized protein GlcG (DUF336 family)
VPIVFSLVDAHGLQRYFVSQDNALLISHTLATQKAWTAVALRMPTHRLAADVLPGASLYGLSHTQGLCCFGGGLPCWSAGVLLGGIGISGGSVEEDIAIATQTLARFSRERFCSHHSMNLSKKRIQTGVIMSSASLVLVINCGSSSQVLRHPAQSGDPGALRAGRKAGATRGLHHL